MKILSIIILFLFGILQNNYGQFQKFNVPESIVGKFYNKNFSIPAQSGVVNLTKYLPKGYSKIGKVDYTKFIQKGINANRVVVLPNFPILINKQGLKIPSNTTIYFQRNSQILFSGPAQGKFFDIVIIENVKNVKIYNANIVGSRFINKGKQSGEWSAGISIKDSENVRIENAKITNTFGDGIFVGSETGSFSQNVDIKNVWIDQARRNGVSITSVIGLSMKNILVSNVNGTLPENGIHIEPSLNSEVLQKINISDISSYNNKNSSFGINLSLLNSNNSNKSKMVDITASNFKDYGSSNFIGFVFNPEGKKTTTHGIVNLNNFVGENTKKYKVWFDRHPSGIKINSTNISTVDKSGKRSNLDLSKGRTQ